MFMVPVHSDVTGITLQTTECSRNPCPQKEQLSSLVVKIKTQCNSLAIICMETQPAIVYYSMLFL
jgi:hypothetical protein